MDNDNKFILWCIGIAAITILACSYTCCHHSEKMAAMGYQETAIAGTSNTLWQKVK